MAAKLRISPALSLSSLSLSNVLCNWNSTEERNSVGISLRSFCNFFFLCLLFLQFGNQCRNEEVVTAIAADRKKCWRIRWRTSCRGTLGTTSEDSIRKPSRSAFGKVFVLFLSLFSCCLVVFATEMVWISVVCLELEFAVG